MDYSLLIGIERDEKQKLCGQSRKASYVENIKAGPNLSFQHQRETISSSLNSAADKESDPIRKFDKTSRNAHIIKGKTETIHLSIIDYLQEWNLNKKIERAYKVNVLQKSGSGLSAVEPDQYAQRFKRFVERFVLNV